MVPEMIVALVAFIGLVAAWVVLPTRGRSHQEVGSPEIESA